MHYHAHDLPATKEASSYSIIMKWPAVCSTLLLLAGAATQSVVAFTFFTTSSAPPSLSPSFHSTGGGGACQLTCTQLYASSSVAVDVDAGQPVLEQRPAVKDRPLLRQFGKGINDRIMDSSAAHHCWQGLEGHYTSEETIPCLNMHCGDRRSDTSTIISSTRKEIRDAYTADSKAGGMHGRSSGSGCSIIRLTGKDAASVRGLVDFADDFFDGVDDDACNVGIKDLGIMRVANNVHAGFDANVNNQGKMQVLFTKIVPGQKEDDAPSMLPFEVGDMVGSHSMSKAHHGMNTLIDIGSQLSSAVLGLDSASTDKLLDDCTRGGIRKSESTLANQVSNSYQRLIRYLEPQQTDTSENGDPDPAFWPHVDSTFLTLIPMTAMPGLEVWCPSSENAMNSNLAERGEWVRPIKPIADTSTGTSNEEEYNEDDDCVEVFALAGEFLQLLSDGNVPTCIHRVIPPKPASPASSGVSGKNEKYVPRVSAPVFVRPRRGEDATLDVQSDLNEFANESKGLHFEEGLLEECDGMCIWEYMDCMSPDN